VFVGGGVVLLLLVAAVAAVADVDLDSKQLV
jgi:hypothetical protein